MIRITCTNCKAQLSIDEAFAGGVCRCQYCGTIQTVPKHMKNAGVAEPSHAKAGAGNGAPRALYKDKGRAGLEAGSGLDAIAEIVASSGLSGSGLASGHYGRKPPEAREVPPPAPRSKTVPILIGSAVVIVLLLGVVIGLLMKGGGWGSPNTGGTTPGNDGKSSTPDPVTPAPLTTGADTTPKPVAIKVTGPAFLGVRLPEPTILFLFDRGSGTHATFDPMKIACLNALDTLRPDQKFQVIFWRIDRDAEPVMYPSAPVNPSPAEIRKCAAALDDVSSFGQSDVKAALEKALAANPGAIVLVTGKPVDDTFARTVLETRKDNPVKVHCLSLGEVSSAGEMREIASKTGGTFRLVPMEELKSVTR